MFSCSVIYDSLRSHGLQPTRLFCPLGFFRQEFWSGLIFPSPGDLSNPRIESPSCVSCIDKRILYHQHHLGSPGIRIGGRNKKYRIDRYTVLYFKWIINKDLLYSTWKSSWCYVAAWMRVEFGGECICMGDTWICMAELLCCLPETITTWLIGPFVVVQLLSFVPFFCNPGSQVGSSIHRISQTRMLEWVAIPFSWNSSQPRN